MKLSFFCFCFVGYCYLQLLSFTFLTLLLCFSCFILFSLFFSIILSSYLLRYSVLSVSRVQSLHRFFLCLVVFKAFLFVFHFSVRRSKTVSVDHLVKVRRRLPQQKRSPLLEAENISWKKKTRKKIGEMVLLKNDSLACQAT